MYKFGSELFFVEMSVELQGRDNLRKGDNLRSAEIRDKTQLYDEVFPQLLRMFHAVLYSKHFPLVKAVYVLMAPVIAVALFLVMYYSSELTLAFKVVHTINTFSVVLCPFISVKIYCAVLETDVVNYVLYDSFYVHKPRLLIFRKIFRFELLLQAWLVMVVVLSDESKKSVTLLVANFFLTILFGCPLLIVIGFFVGLLCAQWYRLNALCSKFNLERKENDKYRRHTASYLPSFLLSSPGATSSLSNSDEDIINNNNAVTEGDSSYQPLSVCAARDLYYKELSICYSLSEECGLSLFVLFALVLLSLSLYVGALYTTIYYGQAFHLFSIVFLLFFQLCFALSSCNEYGKHIGRQLRSYLLSRSCVRDIESDERNDTVHLANFIDDSNLQIRFYSNFALTSSTVLAVVGSVVAATVPGLLSRFES